MQVSAPEDAGAIAEHEAAPAAASRNASLAARHAKAIALATLAGASATGAAILAYGAWTASDPRLLGHHALLTAVVAALSAAAGRALAGRIRRNIEGPLDELEAVARAISRGNFSTRVELGNEAPTELERLGRSVNDMGDRIRGFTGQMRDGVRDVVEVAGQLRISGRALSGEAQRQHTAIAEASRSALEVSASIREVTSNVEQLSDSARGTSSSIVEMDASIRVVAGHMDHLDLSMDATSIAVSQVATNTEVVVGNVETLSKATEETIGRLGELSESITRVEANAQRSRELSDDTSREAIEGLRSVRETIKAMNEITASFSRLDKSVGKLADKSNSIDEILMVIRGVAEQTALLSLNASIIAAQAGQHGQAFAVVAGEINNVATRTRRSTEDIARLIADVKSDTAAAVEASEEGAAVVRKGVQRSNDAGRVLERISEKSLHSTERVHEISDATQHQGRDVGRVNQAMLDVQEIVRQIIETTHLQRAATSEIVAAVGNIRSVAKGVKSSTAEQRRGSELITRAITDVAERINHIVEATQTQAQSRETIQQALGILDEASHEAGPAAINEQVEILSVHAERLEAEIARFETR
jgi:methyl-accepting chemotaxis protein